MSDKLNLLLPGDLPEAMKKLFLAVQTWSRNINGTNLESASVVYSKLSLSTKEIPAAKINWPFEIVLARDATDKTSTSTTYGRCSAPIAWNPSIYPTTGGKWYLECAIAISNATATVSARLMGASEIGAVTHTGGTALTLKTSTELTMPTTAQNLYVEFKTSNGSYTASFAGARLLFIPDA